MSYIILKFDDLSEETLDDFKRAKAICDKHGAVACFGLVGGSLSNPSTQYVSELRKLDDDGVEIWNHGYFHTEEEFSVCTYEQQLESIQKTQSNIEKYLGKPATTFGSPHNNSTEMTVKVLAENFPEISNYFFMADGEGRSKAKQLVMRCNYEIKTGLIDLDFFQKEYDRIKRYPYFVMQGHPSFWGEDDFERFDKMLEILAGDGNSFVTAEGLRKCDISSVQDKEMEHHIGQIESFIKVRNKIYFYGAGEIGREVFRYFSNKGIKPYGFVVSDGHKTISELCGLPVFELKEVATESGIIPTVLGRTHSKIFTDAILEKYDIWMPESTDIYDEIIDYIRWGIS